MKYPLKPRPKARPTDLAMFVIPFAADLSAGETIIVTKVCLAGTSICEIQKRAKRKKRLKFTLLVSAMQIRKTLDGR